MTSPESLGHRRSRRGVCGESEGELDDTDMDVWRLSLALLLLELLHWVGVAATDVPKMGVAPFSEGGENVADNLRSTLKRFVVTGFGLPLEGEGGTPVTLALSYLLEVSATWFSSWSCWFTLYLIVVE